MILKIKFKLVLDSSKCNLNVKIEEMRMKCDLMGKRSEIEIRFKLFGVIK